MGEHSSFYLDVAAPHQGLERLEQILTASVPPALALCTVHFGKNWRPKAWSLQSHELLGPGGWLLRSRQHTVEIVHILKYSQVTLDTDFGAAVVGGINFFGDFLGAERLIFCHELLPVPDLPLDDIAVELSKDFAPAEALDAATHGHFSDGCWAMVSLPITDLV